MRRLDDDSSHEPADASIRVIHVGLDVDSTPIWEDGANRPAENYPLSPELVDSLNDWCSAYTELIDDWDAFVDTTTQAAREHDATGERLWRRVVSELGDKFEVHYDSPIRGESTFVHRPPG